MDDGITPTGTGTGLAGLEREIRNMKSIMAQQNRQMTAQSQAISELLQEVRAMRTKMG